MIDHVVALRTQSREELAAKEFWWVRRVLAKIRNGFHKRPVCWRCWRPFSDWFVWDAWSYCYPCHAERRIVILEPAANRKVFYD